MYFILRKIKNWIKNLKSPVFHFFNYTFAQKLSSLKPKNSKKLKIETENLYLNLFIYKFYILFYDLKNSDLSNKNWFTITILTIFISNNSISLEIPQKERNYSKLLIILPILHFSILDFNFIFLSFNKIKLIQKKIISPQIYDFHDSNRR